MRSRRKPIILHGCRGCGAEFDFTARSDLNLKPSCNMQSVLRDLGWAGDRDIRRNCQTIPESCHRSWVLVYDKVVLGGPCAETCPLTSQTLSIYLQRLNPSETSFRTQGVSQRSEHDTPYLCKRLEWPNERARLVAGRVEKEKSEAKATTAHALALGQTGTGRTGGQSSPESLIALCEMRCFCLLQCEVQYAPCSRPLGRHTPADAIERLSIVGVVQCG